ncbi:hypothetical protein P7K49_027457 [Saguinus oedipus]|uniref:Uncharacterized protein n=1 Tax=Saguinus oedipus TaxID=9490 RepID=A0ABQ9U9I1_SAGOE|nr:hypothetical protein P7K49_027457 [Saguinus oedipus]
MKGRGKNSRRVRWGAGGRVRAWPWGSARANPGACLGFQREVAARRPQASCACARSGALRQPVFPLRPQATLARPTPAPHSVRGSRRSGASGWPRDSSPETARGPRPRRRPRLPGPPSPLGRRCSGSDVREPRPAAPPGRKSALALGGARDGRFPAQFPAIAPPERAQEETLGRTRPAGDQGDLPASRLAPVAGLFPRGPSCVREDAPGGAPGLPEAQQRSTWGGRDV